MFKTVRFLVLLMALFACLSVSVSAQTSGSIQGEVRDEKQAVIPKATVTLRNVQTNDSRTTDSDDQGRYRFNNVPVGNYELTIEAQGFGKYEQSGITLALNQTAVVDASLIPGALQASVSVVENASLLNTTTAEVGVRFDSRRISELPLSTNRNVYNVALSAAGVTQLGAGQTNFAGGGAGATSGVSYSANGGRIRSNNFMIDGQDNNDFGVAGASVPLNNPDLIQEVRLLTNQFTAEYGRNGSSVFNAITKSGTNGYHGSAFWFYNGNALNSCSNTNKAAGFCNPNATNPSLRPLRFALKTRAVERSVVRCTCPASAKVDDLTLAGKIAPFSSSPSSAGMTANLAPAPLLEERPQKRAVRFSRQQLAIDRRSPLC
ncbi:MAG: carboxypeptidase-like regulatory domain-containing protein [Acidobacteriota bacterium]|nr:carboxypeptidase-like regulatory domain-containing protein [Acidobacteriota bacterium]